MTMILALAVVGCGREESANATGGSNANTGAGSPQKVTIVLNWFPEMEHGGFYAAKVHGYYAEVGLDVEIIPGGIDIAVEPRVATGKDTFGVTNADNLVFARAQGADVVALMAPLQVSPRCIMVHEESGITALDQLRDVTLAMNPSGAFVAYLKDRVPLTNVTVVPYAGNIAPFLNDKRHACQAYNFSEPYVARRNGANPRTLMLSDIGFNPYSSILVTRRQLLEQQPEMVRNFTVASLRGWNKYMTDFEESNKVINAANPQMDMESLKFGVDTMQSMVYTNQATREGLGTMTLERWQALVADMERLNLVPVGKVAARDCFDTQFIEGAAAAP